MTDPTLEDRLAVRQLIEDWVLWRDSGDWDRFAALWRPDGFIMTTWCEATASEFIERGRHAWSAGMRVLHTIDGGHVVVEGDRAIAWTKMQIIQRAPVHGVLVDVICHGRFCDALVKEDGRWAMLSRQSVYEGDRMIPVEVGATVTLDKALLDTFPEGYRHLGYLQTLMGLPVNKSLPGTRDEATAILMQRMRRWLIEGDRALVRSAAAGTAATAVA